jgi:tetratricopeptide (TPR) repeat protein
MRNKYLTAILIVFCISVACAEKGAAEQSFFDVALERQIELLKQEIGKPRALLDLYFICELVDYAQDRDAVYSAISSVLTEPRASALLKSEALYTLGLLDARRGDIPAARAKQTALGLVTDWLVIGPFDNEGKSGFDMAYPPEEKIDLKASYEGKEREVRWRQFPPVAVNGYVPLDAIFRPETDAAAYALTWVHSDEKREVAFRFGYDEALKIQLNGKFIYENIDYHPAAFDQGAVGAQLNKGWNRIVLKICQEQGGWGFLFRITRPDGGLIDDLSFSLEPQTLSGTPVEHNIEVKEYTNLFQRSVEKNPASAQGHFMLGVLYNRKKNFDREEKLDIKHIQEAIKLDPKNKIYLHQLGMIQSERNQRRRAFESAIKLAPDFAPAYFQLGQYFSDYKMDQKAREYFRKTLELDPSLYTARLGTIEYYAANAREAESTAMLAELMKKYPDAPYLYYFDLNRNLLPVSDDELVQKCESYLRYNQSHVETRQKLANIYLRQLKHDKALNQLAAISRIDPSNTGVYLEAADIYSDSSDLPRAINAVNEYLQIAPEDAGALEKLGHFQHRLGDTPAALATWRRALTIKPQNPELKEYIELLQPKEKPFEENYAYDPWTLINDLSETGSLNDDSALSLLDLRVIEVHSNGLSNVFEQRLVKLLTKKALEDFKHQYVGFAPGDEEVKVQSAKIYKADGSVINASGPHHQAIQNPDGGLFYNYQAEIFMYSGLEVGDVIEFRYRKNQTATENVYADYFGNIKHFQSRLPQKLVKYVVITPADKKFYHQAVKMDIGPQIELSNGKRTYIWEMRDVEKIEIEPGMPGLAEIVPYVHISTFADWEEMGRWYWGLVQDQFTLHKQTREKVHEIVDGIDDELERVRAIHGYVVRNTRYIGLEFGIHGHKPYKAHQVFSRKYGDCKDKACLLKAMLAEIGVQSNMAVLRTRSKGKIQDHPASLAVFDHAISYIPKYDLWLDGTAEFSGSRDFPFEDQGAMVLLVDKDRADLTQTPVMPAENSSSSYEIDAALAPDGELKFKANREIGNTLSSYYRSMYQDESMRRDKLEKSWRAVHPDITIDTVTFGDISQLEEHVKFKFEATAPRFAVKRNQNALAFSPFLRPANLTKTICSLVERKFDLRVNYTYAVDYKITLSIPTGFDLERLPDDFSIDNPYIAGDIKYDAGGDTITVKGIITMKKLQVPVKDYSEFREACRLIDEKQTEKIIIEKNE